MSFGLSVFLQVFEGKLFVSWFLGCNIDSVRAETPRNLAMIDELFFSPKRLPAGVFSLRKSWYIWYRFILMSAAKKKMVRWNYIVFSVGFSKIYVLY